MENNKQQTFQLETAFYWITIGVGSAGGLEAGMRSSLESLIGLMSSCLLW